MGFLGFIGSIVDAIIVKPSNVVTKAVIGVEIFKKPGEAFAKGIAVPLLGAGLFKTAAVASALTRGGPQQPATQQQIQIFQAQQAATRAPPVGRTAPSVTGGASAFSKFGIEGLGGGNPAWRSLGQSVTRLAVSDRFLEKLPGRWVRSGASVRLLA